MVVVDENLHAALQGLLQCHGLGGLRPNTLLLGWSKDPEKSEVFSGILDIARRMRRSIIVVASKQQEERTRILDGAINIWWTHDRNGALMPKADIHNVAQEMQAMLADARIEADLVIMPAESPLEAIREAMQPSAVLFAGFDPPGDDPDAVPLSFLQQTVDLPGDILLVYNAGDVSLQA